MPIDPSNRRSNYQRNSNPYVDPANAWGYVDTAGNFVWSPPGSWGPSMNFGTPNQTGTPAPAPTGTPAGTPAATPRNTGGWDYGTDQNAHGGFGMQRDLTPYEDASGQRRASGWTAHRFRRGKGYLGGSVGSGPMLLPSRNYWDLRKRGLGSGGRLNDAPTQNSNAYADGGQWNNGLVNWSI